ncbi:hypothetical protein M5K25_007076 [Dendrobium thyrsiflorum]|uniref:Uncharacterized protein n=1 Tax=Dendrobium thyrsiflorum TaxID=117978 RepID=A0ABD0VD71_DENTH
MGGFLSCSRTGNCNRVDMVALLKLWFWNFLLFQIRHRKSGRRRRESCIRRTSWQYLRRKISEYKRVKKLKLRSKRIDSDRSERDKRERLSIPLLRMNTDKRTDLEERKSWFFLVRCQKSRGREPFFLSPAENRNSSLFHHFTVKAENPSSFPRQRTATLPFSPLHDEGRGPFFLSHHSTGDGLKGFKSLHMASSSKRPRKNKDVEFLSKENERAYDRYDEAKNTSSRILVQRNINFSIVHLFDSTKVKITKKDIGNYLHLRTEGVRAHSLASRSNYDWTAREIHCIPFTRVQTLNQNARIIQHILRSSIIPKDGDRMNITPFLSLVAYFIINYVKDNLDIGKTRNEKKGGKMHKNSLVLNWSLIKGEWFSAITERVKKDVAVVLCHHWYGEKGRDRDSLPLPGGHLPVCRLITIHACPAAVLVSVVYPAVVLISCLTSHPDSPAKETPAACVSSPLAISLMFNA